MSNHERFPLLKLLQADASRRSKCSIWKSVLKKKIAEHVPLAGGTSSASSDKNSHKFKGLGFSQYPRSVDFKIPLYQ